MMALAGSRHLLLTAMLLTASALAPIPAIAANRVLYLGSPLPPVGGVLLPEAPSTLDRVYYRQSLGFTFTNSCFASAANGDADIVVDLANRLISLDFDETTATLSPFCVFYYDPVSTMQLELDPLPAGTWTLEVDEMLSIFLPRPPQSLIFEVAAQTSEVPTGGVAYLVVLGSTLALAAARLVLPDT